MLEATLLLDDIPKVEMIGIFFKISKYRNDEF